MPPRRQRPSPKVAYMWTWNNPTMSDQEILQHFDAWNLRYACFQREQGEQGTVHIQGYLEFKKKLRMTQVFSLPAFPQSHLEERKGTREQARDYCMKPDTRISGPYEWPNEDAFGGVIAPGKRTDLDAVAELVRTGASITDVAAAFPTAVIKYNRGISALISLNVRYRLEPPTVILNYGPTGCGKSRMAMEFPTDGGRWVNPIGKGGWFNGYTGQSVAIFDDFAGSMSHTQLTDLLRILDRYALQVPVKGDFTWFSPTTIIVTTNIHPKKWYDYSARMEHYRALRRRFSIVNHWRQLGEEPKVYTPADERPWELFWNGPIEEENGIAPNFYSRAILSDPYMFM